ncbi:MAG: DUF6691 family protein [Bacteroidota bacterium]
MNDVTTVRNTQINSDFEVGSLDELDAETPTRKGPWSSYIKFLITGILFGIVLVKAEVISWFRIQEMFRLQSFHMYGVIGSAVVTGIISVQLIKRFNIKTLSGEQIRLPQRKFSKGQIYGGLLFGFGWALTGACPGPMFALIGTGSLVVIVALLSAIVGTWTYGYFQEKLPH